MAPSYPAPQNPAPQNPARQNPARQGLYDHAFEHDACGVAFVVDMHGRRTHGLVEKGINALCNLEHRGASGSETNTGDGAGILIQVPDAYYRAVVEFELPEPGAYATGIGFLPSSSAEADLAEKAINAIVADEGLAVIGWREVLTNSSMIGASARAAMPSFRQVFITGSALSETSDLSGIDLDRRVFIARKRVEREVLSATGEKVYFSSLSARTIVYKGMLTTPQLREFFPELSDERIESSLALVHSRFSTNTFPSWPLAHPYRFVAHNGEINTLKGNRNWMRAREALLASDLLPGDLDRIFPICDPNGSDSASFDEVLELLHLGGRSLPHAVLMMIPEAWENHESMSAAKRAFYRFHSSVMEPWDGPADIAFTDGTVIGAVLDRNGLRPSRIWVTDDGLVIMASEVGVLDIDPARIVMKRRLEPGRMFLVDTAQGRIIEDEEIKAGLASDQPYADWLDAGLVH
ncbi:MAG: glutamate synthase subunit alpha, partial [Acidimicrobiia bacterium]|nr:glutamate synthase subunit alpha [Acidimicrobiia bacterium]